MAKKNYITLPMFQTSIIESMRSIGHSMETAVSDIIDNSITAKSKNVWIDYSWSDGNPYISIADDGCGMTESGLLTAMQFGSSDPKSKRPADDLGRFGLGLKTASMSQCRRFSVVTRINKAVTACAWDYDHEGKGKNFKWEVELIDAQEVADGSKLKTLLDNHIGNNKSGTVVLWENLDRLSQSGGLSEKEHQFNRLMLDTRKHLELVFHRFLSPEPGNKRFNIFINGDALVPFNPFNEGNIATIELPNQNFKVDGEQIRVSPFVLPHPSKVSQMEWDKFEGDSGYVNGQGFYIYRSRRLIVAGTWFRLLKKQETNKLIRIRVDIPNSLDHLWKIDVKKSGVVPPEAVLKQFKQVINKIEITGKKVFLHRGQILLSSSKFSVWNRRVVEGNTDIRYEVNRKHPLFQKLSNSLSPDQNKLLNEYVSMAEMSYPATLLYNDFSDNPKRVIFDKYDEETLAKLADIIFGNWDPAHPPEKETIDNFLTTDPFTVYPEVAKNILIKKGLLK